jgi:hypothetical protein
MVVKTRVQSYQPKIIEKFSEFCANFQILKLVSNETRLVESSLKGRSERLYFA